MVSKKLLFTAIFTVFIAISSFFYFYKLDYAYFFTDEILYIKAGQQIFEEKYFLNASEVPITGKYIAGIAEAYGSTNVFKLRSIYALMGILSSIIVFLILKEEYSFWYGIAGGLTYVSAPLIFESTRMVMLESPLFLIWLLFHYFFIKFLKTKKYKFAIISGILIGLGLSIKLPTLILFPFSFVMLFIHEKFFKNKLNIKNFYKLLSVYFLALFVYVGTYIPEYIYEGMKGINKVAKQVYEEYFQWGVSAEKIHIIAGKKIKSSSPWWTYLYYFQTYYNPLHLASIATGFFATPFMLSKRKNFFGIYWLTFFGFSFALMQMLSIKNGIRYAAEFELPMIFIAIYGFDEILKYFNEKLKRGILPIGRIPLHAITLIAFLLILIRLPYILNQQPTKYNALKIYLSEKTQNFTVNKKIYIHYDSSRSAEWYFNNISNLNKDKNPDILNSTIPVFDYVAIDKEAAIKSKADKVFKYISKNKEAYELIELDYYDLYSLKGSLPDE